MEKVEVGGVKFYPFENKMELLKELDKSENKMIFAVNARKIMTSPDSLKKTISDHFGYIDGHGAIWAAKRMGYNQKMVRIPGVELWLSIIKNDPSKRFYLLGAKQEVLDKVVRKLNEEIPEINLVGYRNGYFNQNEIPCIAEDIKIAKPDYVFVALGSPLQEKTMMRLYKDYATSYMGVGGSFDVYSENVERAPKVFQKLGLEGMYRFASNPKRLLDREIFYGRYFKQLITGKF